jgi:hypothetical protein
MSVSKIADFKLYKKAKRIHKDLTELIEILTISSKYLTKFNKYAIIKELLKDISIKKSILLLHAKKYKSIIDNKGIRHDKLESSSQKNTK